MPLIHSFILSCFPTDTCSPFPFKNATDIFKQLEKWQYLVPHTVPGSFKLHMTQFQTKQKINDIFIDQWIGSVSQKTAHVPARLPVIFTCILAVLTRDSIGSTRSTEQGWEFWFQTVTGLDLCTTGRYWGCYPPWPDAGTPEGPPQTLPLTPGPRRPPCSDSRAASSCGRSPGGGAPDTPVSSGRGPAGAAGSSLWKSGEPGLRHSPHSNIYTMEDLF